MELNVWSWMDLNRKITMQKKQANSYIFYLSFHAFIWKVIIYDL